MLLMLSLHALDVGFHAIQAALPSEDVTGDPRFGRLKRVRFYFAGSDTSGFFRGDEPALFEHAHVFEEGWQGQFKGFGQLADGFGPVTESADDCPARWVGKR